MRFLGISLIAFTLLIARAEARRHSIVSRSYSEEGPTQALLTPDFSYAKLRAVDKTSGAVANLLSGLGVGFELGVLQPITAKWSVATSYRLTRLQFSSDAQTTLTQPGLLSEFKISPVLDLSQAFRLIPTFSVGQSFFFTGSSATNLVIDGTWILGIGLAANLEVYSSQAWHGDIEMGAHYLVPKSSQNYSIQAGYSAYAKALLSNTQVKPLTLTSALGVEYLNQSSSLARQFLILGGLDLTLSWNFGGGRGTEDFGLNEEERLKKIEAQKEELQQRKKQLLEKKRTMDAEKQRLRQELKELKKEKLEKEKKRQLEQQKIKQLKKIDTDRLKLLEMERKELEKQRKALENEHP